MQKKVDTVYLENNASPVSVRVTLGYGGSGSLSVLEVDSNQSSAVPIKSSVDLETVKKDPVVLPRRVPELFGVSYHFLSKVFPLPGKSQAYCTVEVMQGANKVLTVVNENSGAQGFEMFLNALRFELKPEKKA